MGIIMVMMKKSFLYYPSIFSVVDWFMLLGMTLCVIGAQTFKLKAFQNQTASKLQVLGNLPMVYNFFFDVYLFNTHFTSMQYWGIIVTMLTFVLDIYITFRSSEQEAQQILDPKKDDDASAKTNSARDSIRTNQSTNLMS